MNVPLLPRAAWLCALFLLPLGAARAARIETRTIDEHRAADPQAQIEIVNVSGGVEVSGWDRPEIEVTGTLGAAIDRLDISTTGSRIVIRVVPSEGGARYWGSVMHSAREAFLVVHMPRGGSLSASLVSADLSVTGVQGDQELQTVSGDIRSSAARDVRIHSVSGDVHLAAGPAAGLVEIGSVSGEVEVNGGHGELSVSTVSGGGKLVLGTLMHARLKTVSGDFQVHAALAPDGLLEAQSVSGDIALEFIGGAPAADYELHSVSGALKACFGPAAVHEGFGAGSRLSFRSGAGGARVRIDTQSGAVSLCAQSLSGAHSPDPAQWWPAVRFRATRHRPSRSHSGTCELCLLSS